MGAFLGEATKARAGLFLKKAWGFRVWRFGGFKGLGFGGLGV